MQIITMTLKPLKVQYFIFSRVAATFIQVMNSTHPRKNYHT